MKSNRLLLLCLMMVGVVLSVQAKIVSVGPWVTDLDETSITVMFTTEQDALTWVELAPDDGTDFYAMERPRYYQTVAGRRTTGTLHKVRIEGLQPGTAYRYRVCGKFVLDDSDAYGTRYDREEAERGIGTVRTLDPEKTTCRFSMINDMHDDLSLMASLFKGVDPKNMDFLVMNGDIVSYAVSIDTVTDHIFSAIPDVLRNTQLLYVRGNHEGRGRDFDKVPALFPTNTGEFYFSFRQGRVAFLVLDAGEDKPDSDVEYSGTADYDAYRAKEVEWLHKTINDPEFASAPVKICLIHVPMNGEDGWYTERILKRDFLPLINEAGVQLVLSGHYHRYGYMPKGKNGCNFEQIINSNKERMDVEVGEKRITVRSYDADGKLVHSNDIAL